VFRDEDREDEPEALSHTGASSVTSTSTS
jgi:hypothetical protein